MSAVIVSKDAPFAMHAQDQFKPGKCTKCTGLNLQLHFLHQMHFVGSQFPQFLASDFNNNFIYRNFLTFSKLSLQRIHLISSFPSAFLKFSQPWIFKNIICVENNLSDALVFWPSIHWFLPNAIRPDHISAHSLCQHSVYDWLKWT